VRAWGRLAIVEAFHRDSNVNPGSERDLGEKGKKRPFSRLGEVAPRRRKRNLKGGAEEVSLQCARRQRFSKVEEPLTHPRPKISVARGMKRQSWGGARCVQRQKGTSSRRATRGRGDKRRDEPVILFVLQDVGTDGPILRNVLWQHRPRGGIRS